MSLTENHDPHRRPARSQLTPLAKAIMFHPLFDHSVLLPTKMIQEMYKIVKTIVLLRSSGNVFVGESGAGKTDAVERIRTMLLADFPGLPIYIHDAHNHNIATQRAFYKHFLHTVGLNEQKGETADLRARLLHQIVDDARVSGYSFIILFIDESNAMLVNDFLFLKDVYNDLAHAGVQLLTILVGQSPQMQGALDKLLTAGRTDLSFRFATRVHEFRGFCSVEALQFVFNEIDSREFPVGSGKTWTEFFLPVAWKAGYRLANEAERCLQIVATEWGVDAPGKISLPARPMFLAIRRFLLNAAEFDSADIQIPEDIWREVAVYAKIQESIRPQGK